MAIAKKFLLSADYTEAFLLCVVEREFGGNVNPQFFLFKDSTGYPS